MMRISMLQRPEIERRAMCRSGLTGMGSTPKRPVKVSNNRVDLAPERAPNVRCVDLGKRGRLH